MARLTDTELERPKTEVSLVCLIEGQGYPLQRQGKDYVMCCPFHPFLREGLHPIL